MVFFCNKTLGEKDVSSRSLPLKHHRYLSKMARHHNTLSQTESPKPRPKSLSSFTVWVTAVSAAKCQI